MMRTIYWFVSFVIALISTVPFLVWVKILDLLGKNEEKEICINKVTSNWAKGRMRDSGAQIEVSGDENIPDDIPVVFMSNHQGDFDIAIFMSMIKKPKGYMSKIEMSKVPILRKWMEYMHCVFMERGNARKALEAINKGIDVLRSGHSLVIFPEGTRSKGTEMGKFKAGSLKLAIKAEVPIVPVTIDGSYRLMEANNGKIKPSKVRLIIHPMVETKGLSKEEMGKLPERVEGIIRSGLK